MGKGQEDARSAASAGSGAGVWRASVKNVRSRFLLAILLSWGAAAVFVVSLGRQVLRAETAALWGLCVLGAEWL